MGTVEFGQEEIPCGEPADVVDARVQIVAALARLHTLQLCTMKNP